MHSLDAAFLTLALLSAPNVERADCGNAADRHRSAAARVIEAAHAYAACVAAGHKHDDCAAEMQTLDNAHDDFADAVADLKDCQ